MTDEYAIQTSGLGAIADDAEREATPDVLLIDDSEFIHALLEKKFEHEPITLHGAMDGLSGIALAERIRPALVLLDLTMPGIDGFQTLYELRQDSPITVAAASKQLANVMYYFKVSFFSPRWT